MKTIIILLCFSLFFSLTKDDIPNFEKYFKPFEFNYFDMFNSSSLYSWYRFKQSEHFFVFWEKGFGLEPNSENVPSDMRVDIDALLIKMEDYFKVNIEVAKFINLEENKSYLDIYKMQIYIQYRTGRLVVGYGYDNVIGAMWLTPAPCREAGTALAHEIGHSFQYQIYCDQLYRKEVEPSYKSGFRYIYEGSDNGIGLWEQTAQWQAHLVFPSERFYDLNFEKWPINCHRHFEHEALRYASYFLHVYWSEKRGIETIGIIWNKSRYPDDSIQTYMKLYLSNDYDSMKTELFDYAMKMATYDLDALRIYSLEFVDKYETKFYENNGYFQISYKQCPGNNGFNVIPLNIPESNKIIQVEFIGLEPGSELAPEDPGEWLIDEYKAGGIVRNYNDVNKGNVGWKYGFVTLNSDDSRTYSEEFNLDKDIVSFEVPKNAKKLFMVVQGCPSTYIQQPWDNYEINDPQFPYKLKFVNTSLKTSES